MYHFLYEKVSLRLDHCVCGLLESWGHVIFWLISSRLWTNTTICYLIARDYMYHMNWKPQQNWHPIFKSFIYTKVCQPSIWTNFRGFFFLVFFFLSTISSSFLLLSWLFLPFQPRCWLLKWLDQRWPFCVKTGVKKMLKSLCLLYFIS